jgi:hypothetical protein
MLSPISITSMPPLLAAAAFDARHFRRRHYATVFSSLFSPDSHLRRRQVSAFRALSPIISSPAYADIFQAPLIRRFFAACFSPPTLPLIFHYAG